MPRFYFHVYDEVSAEDEEGLELANAGEAVAYALRAARELAADEVRSGKLNLSHRIDVTDETGANVLTNPFRAAVEIVG